MGFPQPARLVGGMANSSRHAGFIQSQDPAGSDRGAYTAYQALHRQADSAFGRCHAQDVADAALDLHAEYERVDEIPAGDRLALRHRQSRGGDGTGRMGHGSEVSVVEGERAGTHRVDESGIQCVQFLAAAHYDGCCSAVEFREKFERELDAIVPRSPGCAANPVDEGAHALVPDRGGQCFKSRCGGVAR